MSSPKRSKRKLINKKFQLKTTFSVIGIILIAFITLIAATGIVLTDSNKKIVTALDQIKESAGITENDTHTPVENKDKKISGRYDSVHRINIANSIQTMEDLSTRNRIIITAMVGIAIFLGIILYFYLINVTHRISGPIYVLSSYIKQIMEGDKPDIRSLRKNDEFKEFYEQFIEFIDKMYEKDN